MDKKNKVAEKFDWTLSFILLLFFLTSCAAIYSAQTTEQYIENYFLRQIAYYVIGAIIIAIVMFFDSYQYRKLSWYLYGFGILLLVVLYLLPLQILHRLETGQKAGLLYLDWAQSSLRNS